MRNANHPASRGARAAVLLGLFVAGLFIATSASHAYVPRANRVIDAVADANKQGRRVRALRYQLSLRIGDGPAVAAGELVSHPTGLARLELRAAGGLVERHILLGDQHSASRNSRLLVRPRAFLPPLFVLQSNSGAVLEAALGTLGVDRRLLGLAPCGDFDCYVIGDPVRAIRKPMAVPVAEPSAEGATPGDVSAEPEGFMLEEEAEQLAKARTARRLATAHPSLWVDTDDHNVRRIEDGDGVVVKIGPYVKFEHLMVPRFWTIEEPGKREVKFEVEGVVEVNAPAAAFSRNWLMAPLIQSSPGEGEGEGANEMDGEVEGEGAKPDAHVSSLTLEPLPPTPAVSSGPSEEDLEELGFGSDSPGEGYDYPN